MTNSCIIYSADKEALKRVVLPISTFNVIDMLASIYRISFGDNHDAYYVPCRYLTTSD